ncbi:putative Zn peptidase [Candidatus Filomicrobium marinum]|uniref:Putative Zn peptidase n=1 Tax=Candidatus Filomicrobium marinum TaxID=1608628 RepID=A0A0D6JIK0_9HYPH|nr:ImmA/IrrE family metallo-endopeptidase [Candidatus Filomicrobium marinum]CFX36137.1 putative Zn peptidase [Candidatus Filomicrobium marinum]CPR21766.1 putative Zn peptidase [Candidatus Filomicrobium marinum]
MNRIVQFPAREGFIPQRLSEARLSLMMSRADLARRLGVTGQAIGYYETGERCPDMQTLLRLSEELEQPVSYFLKPHSPISGVVGARFFRKIGPKSNKLNQSLDVRTKWLWENVQFLLRHVRLPSPNIPLVDGPANDSYTLSEIEEIAERVRRTWGLGDGPIANMIALLETNGVIVSRFEVGLSGVDAFSAWIDGRPYILLGSDKGSAARSRFDAAHELGHMILHRDISQEDLDDKAIRDRIEREANWFASAFLVPRKAILAEFYSTRLRHLEGLKQRWRVSMQALAHRARDVGVIDDDQYILFRKQVSARKLLTKEPLDDVLPLEQATLLLKAWRLVMERGVVDRVNFEQEVGFSLEIVQRLNGKVPEQREVKPANNVTLLHPRNKNA